MSTRTLAALAALGLTAGAASAADPTLGTTLGTDAGAIADALTAEAYEMTRYTVTGDRIDVTAIRDDARLDLVVDATTGEVIGLQAGLRRGAPDRAGLDDAAIREMIAAEGYQITRYERERGEIEIYATRDGRRWELKVDPLTGHILRSEGDS
ncbi:PepSY domain-containing protein [Psychromarinibacter sp. C21-152]|uniref:PepSY domain-containing protein n=1 Tax=Psychromarinibacter sediminicola TaxID=3033385 RepID=A0AAE3T8U2_9RHOB|nr:PepSY domain-containing protein [Psychromarinibacter sediminicola]MDF0601088.1 PepSY domain-containing protein [Psychromarinibacter sediminicola]